MKIISLDPVATDIILALGLADALVAISPHCGGAPGLAGLPRYDKSGEPVTAQHGALSGHVASSTVVIVREALPDSVLASLVAAGGTTIAVAPEDFVTLWADIERVGAALGLGMLGAAIAKGLRARLDDLRRAAAGDVALRSLAWVADEVHADHVASAVANAARDDAKVAITPLGQGGSSPTIRILRAEDVRAATRVGPRSVALVEMLAAAAWPERHPGLAHRFTGRFERSEVD